MPTFSKEMRFRLVAPACYSSMLKTFLDSHSLKLESSPKSSSVSVLRDVLKKLCPFNSTRQSQRTSNCFLSFTISLYVKIQATKGSKIFWLSRMRKGSSKFWWTSSQMLLSSRRKEEQSRLCALMWSQGLKRRLLIGIQGMTVTHLHQAIPIIVRTVRTLSSTKNTRLTLSLSLIPQGARLSSRCLTQGSALRKRTRWSFSSCLAVSKTQGRWTPKVLAWGLSSQRTLLRLSMEGLESSRSMEGEPSLLLALSLEKTMMMLKKLINKSSQRMHLQTTASILFLKVLGLF